MKRPYFLILVIVLLPLFVFAQQKVPVYKNEIGIDATAFVQQFFNFNHPDIGLTHFATYQFTYKKHLPKYSLRISIGTSFGSLEKDRNFAGVDYRSHSYNRRLIIRTGVEKIVRLYPKWNLYYGVDLMQSYSSNFNDSSALRPGAKLGRHTINTSLGTILFFGVQFKLYRNLFLQTESSFNLLYYRMTFRPLFEIIDPTVSILLPNSMPYTDTGFSTKLFPASALTISYKF